MKKRTLYSLGLGILALAAISAAAPNTSSTVGVVNPKAMVAPLAVAQANKSTKEIADTAPMGAPETMQKQHMPTTTHATIQIIDTQSLKSMLDSGANLTLVDARTPENDDGRRIDGAKSVPVDATEEQITMALPSKDALIIVYCYSVKCPDSKTLADRLVSMGYTNVQRYADGVQGWESAGYSFQTAHMKY